MMEEAIAKLLNTSSSDREQLRDLMNDYFNESDATADYDSEFDDDDTDMPAECDAAAIVESATSQYGDELSADDNAEYEKAEKFR